MTKEALKLALEALEMGLPLIEDFGSKEQFNIQHKAIAAIYETLAQTEQEPVVGTKTWFEDGKVVTQHLTAKDIYKEPEQEPCGGCGGSGWVPRDPDIGTDQECFVCGGSGVYPKEPEQEPWSNVGIGVDVTKEGVSVVGIYKLSNDSSHLFYSQFYTTPPQRTWVGLTDEEILAVNMSTVTKLIDEPIVCDTDHNIVQLGKAIEAKLKEKNT